METPTLAALTFAALGVLPILMIVAGLHDLTTMRIPNWISLALIVAFFPAASRPFWSGWRFSR